MSEPTPSYFTRLLQERLPVLESRRAQVGPVLADWEMAQSCCLPYADPAAQNMIRQITVDLAQLGETVLQIHLLANNEANHVRALLAYFDPPENAIVLDAGCGLGGVAQHMKCERPDLDFILLNLSSAQLELCPDGFRKIHASYEDMPLPDDSVDAVMFNYSLGHGRLDRTLSEAARVLKPRGVLFIYDLTATDSAALIVSVGYQAYPITTVTKQAVDSGFRLDLLSIPENTKVEKYLTKMNCSDYLAIYGTVSPVIYRFLKQQVLPRANRGAR
jgi:ubiquinone/menaquinone biosynthesis C-methylase UbiE